jgi:hypothetical protein
MFELGRKGGGLPKDPVVDQSLPLTPFPLCPEIYSVWHTEIFIYLAEKLLT